MRTFGNDSPEFFEFKVEGFEGVQRIPLMASLPVTLSARFADIYEMNDEKARNNAAYRLQVDILVRYLPAEVVDVLDAAAMGRIMEAYVDASSGEAEAGE